MPHRSWTSRNSGIHPPKLHDNLLGMIGNTPLVRLSGVTRDLPAEVEVWAKLEFMNPGGSVKDRPARQIILDAIAQGLLGQGQRLIDATSGNTGIAYAMLGAALDIPVTLVMPGNTSEQRKRVVTAFGAEIIASSEMEGSDGAITLVREILEADTEGNYYYADQYSNPSNPLAHTLTTAPEIWKQTDARVTHFVACTGTSGTIMGTGRGLKGFSKEIQIIGAQPADAFHGLEGLKHMPSSIVPQIYDESLLDEIRWIETEAGWDMAEQLAVDEGIAAGNSGGANVVAALQVASTLEKGVVVTVICDHADRYMD